MSKLNIRDRNKNNPNKKPCWEYRFEAASVGGKRKSISKAGFKTKKEALDAGTQALAEYNNAGRVYEPCDISVSDFLDYWLKNYAEVNLAYATIAAYTNIIKNHIKPRIGCYKLKSIDTMILQDLINDIYINRGFTKAFMKNILKILKGTFKYAKKTMKIISSNPSEDVELPKFPHEEKKSFIIQKKDIERLMGRFKNSPYQYYAILVAHYTGLRVSEVYGLTWDCVDFNNKTLTVNKIAKKVYLDANGKRGGIRGKAKTKWYLGQCKNNSSYRTIKISDNLVDALKNYKRLQDTNKESYGDLYVYHYLKKETSKSNEELYRIISLDNISDMEVPLVKTDLVFVKENGEFHGTDSMKYPSKIARYELGINFKFHNIRHTHATKLVESGANIKDVQDRLGHSSILTTMNTYVEKTDKMSDETVKLFDSENTINIT